MHVAISAVVNMDKDPENGTEPEPDAGTGGTEAAAVGCEPLADVVILEAPDDDEAGGDEVGSKEIEDAGDAVCSRETSVSDGGSNKKHERQNVRAGAEFGGTTLPEFDTVHPLGSPG